MRRKVKEGGHIFYACYEDLTKEVAWTVHIREVVNNWVDMGRSVTLFCPSRFPFKIPPECRVVYVPSLNVRIVGEYLYFLLLPVYILFYGIKLKPRALYCREMSLIFFLFVACKLVGIPLIVEINGFLVDDLRIIGTSRLKIRFFSLMQRINFGLADALVFASSELKERHVEMYNLDVERTYVVPNGVDTDLFSPGEKGRVIKNISRLGGIKLDPKRSYVTFVGSFYPHSSTRSIVEASKYVAWERGDVDFLMIGDGHDLPLCRKIAEENRLLERVFFLGVRPHSEIPDFVRASSVLIFVTTDPKRWGNSMKILEYMSSGGAVIRNYKTLFDVPLTHGEDFFFIEDVSPKKLAGAIAALIDDYELRERIGRGARRLILKNFSWRRTATRLLEIIDGQ
ncbi:MAG: glycosyltransferase family 4 protein [Deltaproteobacteria bacterium]|uniref:Glycosyltransferase family 4 protein n=1 Tax=Candidatus Zymogenus saltonus TaxID=2844893 RepID=A0A9D8KEZ8_9DELT|nr:glycosyltransferase family 4 protein [Candidatus Zymogenus saltonus]